MTKFTEENIKNIKIWRDDLRTTTARQGIGKLGDEETGFCCLGRACVAMGMPYDPYADSPDSNVSLKFSTFRGINTIFYDFSYLFSALNDRSGLTFQEIADIIDINLIELNIDPSC